MRCLVCERGKMTMGYGEWLDLFVLVLLVINFRCSLGFAESHFPIRGRLLNYQKKFIACFLPCSAHTMNYNALSSLFKSLLISWCRLFEKCNGATTRDALPFFHQARSQ